MVTIRDRLLTVEDEFQRALADGPDAISAFNVNWERLLTDVDSACDADTLDDETASLAHATALRVSFLAETSVLIYSSCDTLTSQLVDEVEMLMEELTISDPSVNQSGLLCRPFRKPWQTQPGTHQLPSRKRRRDSYTSPTPTETYKRRRPSQSHEEATSQSTTHACEAWPSTLSTAPNVHSHAPTSRKRRLSDADTDVPRQAKRLYTGPRLHAVSDSFPLLHASDPEALCTRRLLRTSPPMCMGRSEASDTGLPPAEPFGANLDITQAGFGPNPSFPASSPLAASFSLEALDGFLSSLLEPIDPLLTLPQSPDTPYTLLDVPLSPPSSSRSSSVSLDSLSSIASLSPPPSYPVTPPPATCSSRNLAPYQFQVERDGDVPSSNVSIASICDPLSIESIKATCPTQTPAYPFDGSIGQDFVDSDWSALFQSMSYLTWTPSSPSCLLKASNEPLVHGVVADIPLISLGPEQLLVVA